MIRLRFLGTAVSISLGALLFPSTAHAAPATVETYVYTEHYDYVVNPGCVGEPIHLVGDLTSRLRATTTAHGQALYGGHTTADMTGVGIDSGTTYILRDSRQITTNIMEFDPFVDINTGAWTVLFISAGGADNLVLTAQEHITVTPDGGLAVSFYKSEVHCVG